MKDLNYFKKLHEAEEEKEETTDTEETDVDITDEETDDETTDEEGDSKDETEEDEEASTEETFVELFNDESFVDAFKVEIKQYISEKLLEDEFNSFTVLPFVEINFKDDVYGVNIEFESAVTINVNEDGKVIEKDIPNVDIVKYKTPEMDNITLLEDEIGKETITMYVTEAIDEIKNVPR